MLHPSKILIIFSLIFLSYIAYITRDASLTTDEKPQNPMIVVSEPNIINSTQVFLVAPSGSERKIEVKTEQFPFYEFGQSLNISGNLEPLAENSYAQENPGYYLANNIYFSLYYPKIVKINNGSNENIILMVRAKLIDIRKSIESNINRTLPEPQAGLLSGILLGTRSEISKAIKENLITVGLIHIIALSGYNITIVAEAFRIFLRRYSANLSFWGAASGVWLFVFSTGFSPSAVRAAIMGTLLLVARKIGRRGSGITAILIASVIMVALNRHILLYDIGFQLSFAAVCGIIFLAPKLEKYFKIFGRSFSSVLAATLAAQFFTFGLISYYFGRVSLISLIANLLVVPIVPLLMFFGFIGSLLFYLSEWLASAFFKIAWFLLTYILKLSEYFVTLRFSEYQIRIDLSTLVAIYLLLGLLTLILGKNSDEKIQQT